MLNCLTIVQLMYLTIYNTITMKNDIQYTLRVDNYSCTQIYEVLRALSPKVVWHQ